MTPTPRNADVLLVSGPVSDAMRIPLRKAYDAMPTPKRVVAIGACAIFGGVFGPSFAAAGGASEILPVDVVVPGCPPPPLAILHGLLLVVERKPPRSWSLRIQANGAGMTVAAQLFGAFFLLCAIGVLGALVAARTVEVGCSRRASARCRRSLSCSLSAFLLVGDAVLPHRALVGPVAGDDEACSRSRFPRCSCSSRAWCSCRFRSFRAST